MQHLYNEYYLYEGDNIQSICFDCIIIFYGAAELHCIMLLSI